MRQCQKMHGDAPRDMRTPSPDKKMVWNPSGAFETSHAFFAGMHHARGRPTPWSIVTG